jgi:hypothetical protein
VQLASISGVAAKRRTAVGLREVCQQGGRDLVGAICDSVGPVRAHISTQDDRRRAWIGSQHERRLSSQRPASLWMISGGATSLRDTAS